MTFGNALLDEALGEISRVALPTKTVADITIASVADGQSQRIIAWASATDEERAAERIHSVNAGMRGRFNSPF
jgi:hypothetical protein